MENYGRIEIGSFTFWPPDKDGDIEIEFNDEVPYGGSRGCCFIHVDKLRPWVAPQNTKETKPKPQLPADIKEQFRRWCDEQTSFPGEFVQIVNDHFWDLI